MAAGARALSGRRRLASLSPPLLSLPTSSRFTQADEEAATHADRAAAGAPAAVVNATPAKKAKHNVAGVGKVREGAMDDDKSGLCTPGKAVPARVPPHSRPHLRLQGRPARHGQQAGMAGWMPRSLSLPAPPTPPPSAPSPTSHPPSLSSPPPPPTLQASGRRWKEPALRANTLRPAILSTSWAKKMAAKAERADFQARRSAVVAERRDKARGVRAAREAAKARKEANSAAAAVVQKITKTSTLQRLMKSKKQRKTLRKADTV